MNKKIVFIMVIVFCLCISKFSMLKIMASEKCDNMVLKETICLNIEKVKNMFEESNLDIPQEELHEILLYWWIAEAVEQYISDTGIIDKFYIDLEKNMLFGSREFRTVDWRIEERYEYAFENPSKVKFKQNSYKYKIEGIKHSLYVDVNVCDEMIYIYPAESGVVIIDYEAGNILAYEQIQYDVNNQIKHYPDKYVDSEWDDMQCIDGHFVGVSLEELGELDYLQIPDDIEYSVSVYLNVASALKRYLEENGIEDVFFFDAEQDIISRVTNMIYTCRLRGQERTLYMDIDAFNMKCHIYQLED